LTDVIVKVEDGYYPVDFLVIDCASTVESTQHSVILGRPFLATAHAVIDCAKGTVGMKFGDREFNLNVFMNLTNSSTEEECFLVDRLEEKEEEAGEGVKKKKVRKKKHKVVDQDAGDEGLQWQLSNDYLNKLDGIVALLKNGLRFVFAVLFTISPRPNRTSKFPSIRLSIIYSLSTLGPRRTSTCQGISPLSYQSTHPYA
ncbi:MAG: hypothetical protein Q8755_03110, partial [Candidatus Phytoplasma australasiaticum]|nr:hypothetical protein [Candidatus Phytoplasma australasiaticum]